MTKIVCLVLLLAVVICSVFGWSCNDLNYELSSLSNTIIHISTYAEEVFAQIQNITAPDFDESDVPRSHLECYDYYAHGSAEHIHMYHLYSAEIKVKGDYHLCYILAVKISSPDLFGGERIIYVVVNDTFGVESISGWRFEKFALWFKELTGFTTRSYKNFKLTNKTFEDIEHDCQIKTEE